jgi:hypothetical protein
VGGVVVLLMRWQGALGAPREERAASATSHGKAAASSKNATGVVRVGCGECNCGWVWVGWGLGWARGGGGQQALLSSGLQGWVLVSGCLSRLCACGV